MIFIFLFKRRADGSFVISHAGRPYHLVPGDPIYDFEAAETAYAKLTQEPPEEPAPLLPEQLGGA